MGELLGVVGAKICDDCRYLLTSVAGILIFAYAQNKSLLIQKVSVSILTFWLLYTGFTG
jgi:hypothetical protein